jgi:hypothetical protein
MYIKNAVWPVERDHIQYSLRILLEGIVLLNSEGENAWTAPQPYTSPICHGAVFYSNQELAFRLDGDRQDRVSFSSEQQKQQFHEVLRYWWKKRLGNILLEAEPVIQELTTNAKKAEKYLLEAQTKMKFVESYENSDNPDFLEAQENSRRLAELSTFFEQEPDLRGRLAYLSHEMCELNDYSSLDQEIASFRETLTHTKETNAAREAEGRSLSLSILESCNKITGDLGFSTVGKVREADMLETAPKNLQSFDLDFEQNFLTKSVNQNCRPSRVDLDIDGTHAFEIKQLFAENFCNRLIQETEKIGYRSVEAEFEPTFRNNERVMVVSHGLADSLWTAIAPYLERRDVFRTIPIGFGNSGTWKPIRLNECMKFSKYMSGTFFMPHIDGPWIPKWDEVSIACTISSS